MSETNHSPAEGPRVLVVDDDAGLRHLLEYGLRRAGFVVRSVADGKGALQLLREYSPDLVVLDVMLPERDGIALLPEIRQMTTVPVVMLTARTELTEKLAGFSAGADDYVGKPFDLDELIARLRTLLRRPQFERTETLEYADLVLDLVRRTVSRARRRIDLSPREFDLLRAFAERPETVLTRSELLDIVWGIDRDVIPNTVETYVSYLRAKIDSGERVKLIQTLRGLGYTLKASSA